MRSFLSTVGLSCRRARQALTRACAAFAARAQRWLLARQPTFWGFFVPALVASFLVFSRSPASNYIFDEQEALLANPYVAGGEVGWLEVFRRDFWGLPPSRTIGSYRPLPNLVWRALYYPVLRPVAPWLLDFANLIGHAAVSACIASFAFRVTRSRLIGWTAGASFLTCAVLTEAVSGVVGLSDVLAGLGVVLALCALRAPLAWSGLLVFLALCLAFGAKESALAAVPLVSLTAFLLAPRLHEERPRRVVRGLVVALGACLALVLYTEFRRAMFPVEAVETGASGGNASLVGRGLDAFLRWFRQPKLPSDPMNNPLVAADFGHRVAGALRVYTSGLVQLVFPWSLAGDYSFPQEPVPERVFSLRTVLGGILLVGPVLAGAFLALRRGSSERPSRLLVALGLIWVPLAYFPHANIVALLPTVRAERFWYVPAIGAALALGVLWGHVLEKKHRFALAFAFAYFGFHVLQARAHALHYTDDLAFWRATVVASPKSAKARLNYAVMVGARGDLEERLAHGRRAIELAPRWPMGQVYQGDTLCRLNRADEAWSYYERGFELDPNSQSLVALALQCLWDKKALEPHRDRLFELADAHPGSWLAFLATDTLQRGAEHNGVDPKYRPRGYNQGPRE